eukprot:2662584-Rhodomonas_salina.3
MMMMHRQHHPYDLQTPFGSVGDRSMPGADIARGALKTGDPQGSGGAGGVFGLPSGVGQREQRVPVADPAAPADSAQDLGAAAVSGRVPARVHAAGEVGRALHRDGTLLQGRRSLHAAGMHTREGCVGQA